MKRFTVRLGSEEGKHYNHTAAEFPVTFALVEKVQKFFT